MVELSWITRHRAQGISGVHFRAITVSLITRSHFCSSIQTALARLAAAKVLDDAMELPFVLTPNSQVLSDDLVRTFKEAWKWVGVVTSCHEDGFH